MKTYFIFLLLTLNINCFTAENEPPKDNKPYSIELAEFLIHSKLTPLIKAKLTILDVTDPYDNVVNKVYELSIQKYAERLKGRFNENQAQEILTQLKCENMRIFINSFFSLDDVDNGVLDKIVGNSLDQTLFPRKQIAELIID